MDHKTISIRLLHLQKYYIRKAAGQKKQNETVNWVDLIDAIEFNFRTYARVCVRAVKKKAIKKMFA